MKNFLLNLFFLLGFFQTFSQINSSCNNWLKTPTTSSFVTAGDVDVSGNKLTVEASFNRASAFDNTISFGKLVSKHTGGGNVNYSLMPQTCEITTDVSGYIVTPPVCTPSLDKTYHVAMVYDGNSLKFYSNGFLLSQAPCTGNLVTNDLLTTIGQIAGNGYPDETQFKGFINEVRIWNVARTQEELRSNMNSHLSNPTTQPGLIAYYTFDDLSNKQGNTDFNGTLNGNAEINSSNTNCAFIVDSCGIIPSCSNWLKTPTTSSFVTVGDVDVAGNKLTVEASFNRASAFDNTISFGKLVSKHTGASNVNYSLMPLQCEITTDVSGYVVTPQVCTPSLDKTYHVAMVYDGSSLKFYSNGFLLSQVPCTGNLVTNDLLTTIGQIAGNGYHDETQFKGFINEVRIWNVARTQEELRSNMNSHLSNPTTQPGLVAYYTFDDLSNKQGNTEFDGTLHGNAEINTNNTNCTFSADSCISAHKPPIVKIIIPANNSKYFYPANIKLSASATDEDGVIKKVEFYEGANLLNTQKFSPFSFDWKNALVGEYIITAKAYDNDGLIATSDTIHLSIVKNQPPIIKIIKPLYGKSYAAPASILISADASDVDGKIIKVAFYSGTTLLHTEKYAGYSWIWKDVAAGDYTITTVATDDQGLETTSAPVKIKVVNNIPPTITIKSPVDGTNYTAPANILLSAKAEDLDGKIKYVEFYVGNILLHTEKYTGYSWLWKNVPEGDYIITAKAFDNWGDFATSAPVHIKVNKKENCSFETQPTFSYNFNGTSAFNINNGNVDSSETVSVTVCNGGQYTQSGYVHSNSSNLYNIVDIASGGIIRFDGYVAASVVLTADQLSGSAGTHTITMDDPNIGGTVVQTTTPFKDINNNGILDEGDCAGDPVVETFTAKPCIQEVCPAESQPTFSYNFNGTSAFNINNGNVDPSETVSVTVCNGGQYTQSAYTHSNSSNLYNIVDIASGGVIRFDGYVAASVVLTADQLSGSAGTHTITMDDPNIGGTVVQTTTPFKDLNNNGILDAGDCAGDPVVETFTAKPCIQEVCPAESQPTFSYNFNGRTIGNTNNGLQDPSESDSITVCNGGQYFVNSHTNSSSNNLYNVTYNKTGGTLLFNGYLTYDAVVTSDELINSAGTYTISLDDPSIAGVVTQTITPFTDLNNNKILDENDCIGDPVITKYIANACDNENQQGPNSITQNYRNVNQDINLKIAPNPSKNIITLYTKGFLNSKNVISIISSTGIIIKPKQITTFDGIIQLDISSLKSGIYTIKMMSGDKIIYKHFVKL